MKFDELLTNIQDEPIFETALLLSGDVDPADVRRQLSRWTSNGRLYQLRRGLYALAPPYQKVKAHPFTIANRLVRPSYVSLQSALGYYGLIPETVPVTTSVTTGRPGEFSTPLGDFVFRHVQVSLFREFRAVEVANRHEAFVATPEKALLDLLYLEKGSDSEAFLTEMRLDIDDNLDLTDLEILSKSFNQIKVHRAVRHLIDQARSASAAYEVL